MAEYKFDSEKFLPQRIANMITDVRVCRPEIIEQQARARKRRPQLAPRGKITILAADHPGRGVTQLANDPWRMADRREYLARIVRVLLQSDFDGFMSTPDMVEDLLILDYLLQEAGAPSFLDGKVLVGCMQRGGVAGVAGEFDDRFSAYTPQSLARLNLDGGKMMFRFAPEEEGTLRTIYYCAEAINGLSRRRLHAFVEPLNVVRDEDSWKIHNDTDALVTLVGIASALGETSQYLWLKIPYCEAFARVASATTLPVLLLGGPSNEDPRQTFEDFAQAVNSGANVRGAMVGRNLTFPGAEDPAGVAQAIYHIVHDNISVDEALATVTRWRETGVDALTKYL